MPDLIPVDEENPFNVNLVPVEGNPFALKGDVGAAIQQQNATEAAHRATAQGVLQHFMTPGNVMQGVQTETPGVMTEADAFRQNQLEDQARKFGTQQAFNTVFGNVPMSQAGALGAGGGGIKAYHGSPYDFERFDLSKIGTGEGAQAYGHGLYFAENPGVAESYRPLNEPAYTGVYVRALAKNSLDKATASGLTGDEAKRAAISDLTEQAKATTNHDARQHLYDAVNNFDIAVGPPPGKMYEVNINADPEHFLDWDKPLSEHSDAVLQSILKSKLPAKAKSSAQFGGNQDITGQEFMKQIDVSPDVASQKLREAGIPGIKYLDQGSRANVGNDFAVSLKQWQDEYARNPTPEAKKNIDFFTQKIAESKPTSNYVVFNDKLINIIKKYGLAGLVAGGASHFTTTPVDHNPFAAQQ